MKIKTNKELLELYPWLKLRNVWTGEVYENECELDAMPRGWRISFGDELCEKINKLLVKANYVNDYRITEIKEKWGELRWYNNGVPEIIFEELNNLLDEYSEKSKHICINCGLPAEIDYEKSFFLPLCEKCKKNS